MPVSTSNILPTLNVALNASPAAGSTHDLLRVVSGDVVTKTNTCNGDGAQTDNIFTITGTVDILDIYGVCTEATNATDLAACSFAIYDGTATLELTDSGAPTDCSGINVGDVVFKNGASATVALARNNNDAGALADLTQTKVRITKKLAVDTYIQFLFNGDVNTDVDIKFYVRYSPVSDDGNIAAA
jgi:hypothetical protein